MSNFRKIKVGDLIAFKQFKDLLPTGVHVGEIMLVAHKTIDADFNCFIVGTMKCLTKNFNLVFFNVYAGDEFEIISKFIDSRELKC